MNLQLDIIRKTGLNYLPNCVILLFGSRARTDFDSDSDYDILIITEDELTIEKKLAMKALIRKALAKQKISADVLLHSKAEVEIRKQITGHIVKKAVSEGIRL